MKTIGGEGEFDQKPNVTGSTLELEQKSVCRPGLGKKSQGKGVEMEKAQQLDPRWNFHSPAL